MCPSETDPHKSAGAGTEIAAVKKRLIELEKEYLKKEILDDLRGSLKQGGKGFWENPAVLLLLGFLLTGVVGTWFTAYWQSQQQAVQRIEQARERALQQKYEISDQINKAVAEIYTASQVMLNPLTYPPQNLKTFDQEINDREVFWKQANRAWLVSSQLLQQKLAVNFKSGEAGKLYGEIQESCLMVSFTFSDILPKLKKDKLRSLKDERVMQAREEILALTNRPGGIRDKTGQLMKVLADEIQSQEEGQQAAPAKGAQVASPTVLIKRRWV